MTTVFMGDLMHSRVLGSPVFEAARQMLVDARLDQAQCLADILAKHPDIAREAPEPGGTLLTWVAIQGDKACLDALLPLSDLSVRNNNQATLLMLSVGNQSPEVFATLLGLCDPLCVDARGFTALMHAVDQGRLGSVEALLPVSDVGAINKEGHTALMVAARAQSVACVRALIAHSDARQVSPQGTDALMCAAMGRQGLAGALNTLMNSGSANECVRLLLPHSLPLNVDQSGRNALMLAARTGRLDVLKTLVAHVGLDTEEGLRKDCVGQGAFDLAVAHSHWACADWLAPLAGLAQLEDIARNTQLHVPPLGPRMLGRLERLQLENSLASSGSASGRMTSVLASAATGAGVDTGSVARGVVGPAGASRRL